MTSESQHDHDRDDDHGHDHDHEHDHDHDHAHDHDHGHDHDHDHEHDHAHADVEHEAEVEQVGSRVTMRLTVPAETVAAHIDEVSKVFRQRAKIQGFRPGKAPMGLIRQRFKEEIQEHVLEHLIPEHVGAEIRRRGLRPLHNPVLDRVEQAPDQPLEVKVYFDVEPEVEIGEYKDLSATRTTTPVTDEAVDDAVGNLRERAAKLESVDGEESAQLGDYVRTTIALFPRDGKGKKLAEEDRFVQLGEERAIPGLNAQLEGLGSGATREFVTELGDSYPNDLLAGKEVTCRVEVMEIKRRHLPAIDDDLARDLGLADLEELRTKTREDFVKHAEQEAERDVERQLLDQVIAGSRIDTPESLVESRLDQSVQRAAQDLARQGIDPRHSIDWSSFRADNRPHAERSVREEMVLDRIVDAESIEVEEADVLAEIESFQDTQGGQSAAGLVQQMRKDGSFDGLRRAMARRRALDLIKRHATIESVEGTPENSSDSSP